MLIQINRNISVNRFSAKKRLILIYIEDTYFEIFCELSRCLFHIRA